MKLHPAAASESGRRVPVGQTVIVGSQSSVKVPTGQTSSKDIEVIPLNATTTQIRVKCGCGQTISLICESDPTTS